MPTLYVSEAIAQVNTDAGDPTPDFGPVSVAMDVYDAYTGGALVDDLQELDASPISQVTPDPLQGYQCVFQSTGHTGTLFIQDAAGVRHPVFPADVGDRQGAVQTVNEDPGPDVVLDAGDIDDTVDKVVMTSVERLKLDALPSGATANSPDAELRDRSTHTGVQPLSSIEDLDLSAVAPLTVLCAIDDGDGGVTYAFATVEDLMANPVPIIFKDEGTATPTDTPSGTLVGSLSGGAPPDVWGYGGPAGGAGDVNVSAVSWTVPTAVPAGSRIVIGVASEGNGAVLCDWSATDDQSNVYAVSIHAIQGSTQQSGIVRGVIATALDAGDTITVTALNPVGGAPMVRNNIAAAAGILLGAASSALDKTATGGAGNTTTFSCGPTAVTTQADEVAFDCIASFGATMDTFTPDTGNGWALAGSIRKSTTASGSRGVALIYKVLATTQQVTGSGTISSASTSHSSSLATYKKA